MSVTDKLLLGDLDNLIFVHAPRMQCLRTSHTLIDRHRITANPTDVAVVQRTSKVKRVCVDVLKELLCIVLLDAFWMEIFSTVGSGTLCHLVLSLRILDVGLLPVFSLLL